MTIYEENGYEDRFDYLLSISEEYDVDYSIVLSLAQLLGESEDFDGLVSSLQDMMY